ncbi:hypothetical protein B0A52_05777 [Exophiala mesophila]|uniref:Uncharacterized protein n=1 Tax=Exophiala mesophila TaxID=212818 RepID=A0A438N2J1_EXOME|nr:hypothetical protein B0A52_05777 [Exophiala mesophila]
MLKPKALLKHSKAKKKTQQVLETVDDFQAAGVDLEEAAGKWRAGDAVKSLRFFAKAVDVYNQGLQKYPDSIDLAYNKARTLLEVATHPLLVDHLPIPLPDALQQALDAHQYALNLDGDNPDTLFNTAQVLTSIAELRAANGAEGDAIKFLEDALELQSRCLAVQELKLEESMRQQKEYDAQPQPTINSDADESQAAATGTTGQLDPAEEQWFSIVEPITPDTLVDTVLAQLGTLTTLCSILSSATIHASSNGLAWIEEFSSKLIGTKLAHLLKEADSERLQEAALARANLMSHLLAAGYRLGSLDSSTYKRERDEAFQAPELKMDQSYASLTANAQSLILFNSALMETQRPDSVPQSSQRWNALSTAVNLLAAAAKKSDPVPDEIADTHLNRGNVSLLLYQLGQAPVFYQQAISNAAQILKNAEVFYRNASKLFQSTDARDISQFRAAISQALQAQVSLPDAALQFGQNKDQTWIQAQMEDMIDEGLITRTW